ncbi:MAG: hypothetical protein ACREQN_00975 [Candidatus Binataceae bacterium]
MFKRAAKLLSRNNDTRCKDLERLRPFGLKKKEATSSNGCENHRVLSYGDFSATTQSRGTSFARVSLSNTALGSAIFAE